MSDIFGHSTLDGGSGDDTFKGSGAADVLIGGAGSDTVDFGHKSFVTISLGDPLPYWAGLETPHAQFISIENVDGNAGQDVLVGNGESNILRGQAGQDNLIGGGGADIMYGGTDSDHFYVDNAGDVVREYVGEGTFDVVWTNTSYTLTAGSEIEQFNVEDHNSTTAINLTGNQFIHAIPRNLLPRLESSDHETSRAHHSIRPEIKGWPMFILLVRRTMPGGSLCADPIRTSTPPLAIF